MAIAIDENEVGKLKITLDNGELSKFKETYENWNFKDYQSLMSFMISLVVLNEGPSFKIKIDGIYKDIAPAPDLLKKEGL